MFPHQPGHRCSAFWGLAGTLPAEQAMGPGVRSRAALARDPPATWRQVRFALAVEALALGREAEVWGAGVRHEGIAGKGVGSAINLAPTGLLSENI
jgi:hypothetical protein